MSFDEGLANKIRRAFETRCETEERKMFGGLAFLVGGHMCCGVTGKDLMVRVGPEAYEEALERPHARPMDFTGRPLTGFVYVSAQGYSTTKRLERWVDQALNFVVSLPPKKPKAKKKKAKPSFRALALTSFLISTVGFPVCAHAQPTYEGLWFSLAGGGGLITIAGVDAGKRPGFAVEARIGTTVSGARFAFEGVHWVHELADPNYQPAQFIHATSHIGFSVRAAPSRRLPAYIRGGLGVARTKASIYRDVIGQMTKVENGIGLAFGGGFDVPLSQHVTATWELTGLFQSFAIKMGGLDGEVSTRLLTFGFTRRQMTIQGQKFLG